MDYEQLMTETKMACHERQACRNGYEMLLRSKNVQEILLTAVKNWDDVWRSKYYDIVADNIERWFYGLEQEFHAAGIYVNEETNKGIAIVSRPDKILSYGGRAKVYVFAKAHIVASDHAEVYCRDENSVVELYDHAYGKIDDGLVMANDCSKVESKGKCICHEQSKVYAMGGVLYDHGHSRLNIANGVEIIKS